MKNNSTCKVIKPSDTIPTKQGLANEVGISAHSVGSENIHLHRIFIPPLGKAKAHKHSGHESAIYALEGRSGCYYGDNLEEHAFVEQGYYFYIPANVPHLPYNPSEIQDCIALVARTDPNDQESVMMLPELDVLPHILALPSRSR